MFQNWGIPGTRNLPALAALLDGTAEADGSQTGEQAVPLALHTAIAAAVVALVLRRGLLLILHGRRTAVALLRRTLLVVAALLGRGAVVVALGRAVGLRRARRVSARK
jgi:hypothetical protein